MLTTDDTYTTDAPAIDLAAATRAFLDAARRSMSPQTQADYAQSARKCADNYRAQAYAMLARILIASVSREIAA